MKVKVTEASGAVLDYLVAKCEGVNEEAFLLFHEPTEPSDLDTHGFPEFHYSTIWSQGGPIIEREEIGTERRAPCMKGEEWEAMGSITAKGAGYRYAVGPTPLIAACRCYVASKLGEEAEVPEELL